MINKVLPKKGHVLIIGFPDTESSVVEIANYIVDHYSIPVYFKVERQDRYISSYLLNDKVNLIPKGIVFWRKFLTSKYIIFTHGATLRHFSKKQIIVNVWHGILYKNVGVLIGKSPIFANITVATSPLTQRMFSDAFNVPLESVFICGYPRNDILIREKSRKYMLRDQIDKKLKNFKNILIWLPTYRKSVIGDVRLDGTEIGNPFYIENFDVRKFNRILKENNALCIVKPHPMAPKYPDLRSLSNILFLDDDFIQGKDLTLYQLIACSDILISDVSSVIADYMLLDQPIICMSQDFNEYKYSRGFYFEDIEKWIPSKIIITQEEFFDYTNMLLRTGIDLYQKKRREICSKFFTFSDGLNTKRLVYRLLGDVEF